MDKLRRSNNKVFAGVLGGFADRYDWDPTLVRIAYAVLTVFTGFFPFGLIYIVAAVIMPGADD